MPLKIKFLEDGKRIPSFWADYEDGARVKIRIIPRSRLRELQEEAKSKISFWKEDRLVTEEKNDDVRYERLIAAESVEAWEGFVDAAGKNIPCTDDMKYLLLDTMPGFAMWVMGRAMNAQKYMDEQEAQLAENLSGTSDGNGASPSIATPVPSGVN